MAAFRKTFLALAGVMTLAGTATSAFAQSQVPLNCTVNSVVPYVRYQGLTEQVGDLVLSCTGGIPTPAGQLIPVNNFAVTTYTAATTSKLLAATLPGANGGYQYSESIIALDEPTPAEVATYNPQNACPASNTGACQNYGNGFGGANTPGTSYAATATGHPANYNVFQGYVVADNPAQPISATNLVHTTRFDGVPIDAPGSGTLVVRITNIRVDATPYASASLTNNPITATLSITGTQSIAINNIVPYVVAFPNNGIIPGFGTGNSPVCNPNGFFSVTAQEGFASSFRRQALPVSPDGVTIPDPLTPAPGALPTRYPESYQDVFGHQYFTESGFYNPALTGIRYTATPSYNAVGVATQGTRIWINLTNIPQNVNIVAPLTAYLIGGSTANVPGWLPAGFSGAAHLIIPSGETLAPTNASAGAGAYVPATATDAVFASTANGSSHTFVYEILFSDPSAIETLTAGFTVQYTAGVPTYVVPPTGGANSQDIRAEVSFAPIATAGYPNFPVGAPTANTSYPRFIRSPGTVTSVFFLTGCQCDLLFPYVVSQDGLDTGIAIANTSLDPYGTNPQSGYIQIFYYPDHLSGNATINAATQYNQTTTAKINGGDEFLMVLSQGDGGGIAAAPSFQGYLIAVTGFQYCHGYAFITNTSVSFAEGYIALQLDEQLFLPRVGGIFNPQGPTPPAFVPGEFLGH